MAYNWKNAILLQLFLPRGKKLLAILTTAVQKNFEGQLSYWLLVLYCFGTFFVPLGQSNILQIHDYWKVVDMQLITLHCSFQKKFFRSLEIQSSYKNLIKIKNILCRAIISVSFLKMDFEIPKNYFIFLFLCREFWLNSVFMSQVGNIFSQGGCVSQFSERRSKKTAVLKPHRRHRLNLFGSE